MVLVVCTLYIQFCLDSKETQKHLLGATSKFVAVTYPTLLSKVSAIFNAYYSNDIVDEEVFLAWSEAPNGGDYLSAEKHKAVVENAKQFLEWLKTAEEEDDSDEDDGIGFEGTGTPEDPEEKSVGYGMQRGMPARGAKKDDDDDLDIDDI